MMMMMYRCVEVSGLLPIVVKLLMFVVVTIQYLLRCVYTVALE